MDSSRFSRIFRHALLGLLAIGVFALLFGWVVMTAWNAFVPGIFGLPPLGYGEGVALLILGRILTGRFTHGSHRPRRFRGPARRDSAALYSAWWDAEGEAAFRAYADRHLGKSEND